MTDKVPSGSKQNRSMCYLQSTGIRLTIYFPSTLPQSIVASPARTLSVDKLCNPDTASLFKIQLLFFVKIVRTFRIHYDFLIRSGYRVS